MTSRTLGAALVLPIVGLFPGLDLGWTARGVSMGVVMCLTALITVVAVREPVVHERTGSAVKRVAVLGRYLSALENKPLFLAVLCVACHMTGVSIVQRSLIYCFKYGFGGEGPFIVAHAPPPATGTLGYTRLDLVVEADRQKWTNNSGMGIVAAAAIFIVAGIVVLCFYPITRKFYEEKIRPMVARRDALRDMDPTGGFGGSIS